MRKSLSWPLKNVSPHSLDGGSAPDQKGCGVGGWRRVFSRCCMRLRPLSVRPISSPPVPRGCSLCRGKGRGMGSSSPTEQHDPNWRKDCAEQLSRPGVVPLRAHLLLLWPRQDVGPSSQWPPRRDLIWFWRYAGGNIVLLYWMLRFKWYCKPAAVFW